MKALGAMVFPEFQISEYQKSVLDDNNRSPDGIEARSRATYQRLETAAHDTEQASPNLVAVQRTLIACVNEITVLGEEIAALRDRRDRQAVGMMVATLRSAADILTARLNEDPLKGLLREQKKWVEAGFPEEVVVTDPDGIHFAISSDLLYTILMFKNSSDILEGEEITIRVVDGKALFLVEGEYLPYSSIKNRIVYSDVEKKFLGWNFIHPAGFVPRDRTNFSEMYPIAKLKVDAYARIRDTASQFWSENQDEVDPDHEKGYVLQVMTTGRSCIPRTWWGTNFDDHTPEHSASRLITPDGKVYSFGTNLRPVDSEKVTSLSNLLTTVLSTTSAIDHEEPRPADEKRVTSIPITKERFDAIARYVNSTNKGFAFNFATQNCARFVAAQMALAGVRVNIKMTVPQFFFGLLPNLNDVPVVGRPLAQLVSIVSFVVIPIIDMIAAVLRYISPYPVKRVFEVLTYVIREVLRRIVSVFINGVFFLLMGAGRSLLPPERIAERNHTSDDEVIIPTTPRLLRWWDVFDPDAIIVYHAYKLRLWQNKQNNSVFYTKPNSGFYCIDPAKGTVRS